MANPITQVSGVTEQVMATYLHEDYDTMAEEQKVLLATMINSAKKYLSAMTGIPETLPEGTTTGTVLDDVDEFVDAMFVLVQDMWDNGNLYVDNNNINRTVDAIINCNRRNFL